MKQFLILIVTFLILQSCSDKNNIKVKESKPEWVVDEEKMVEMILDLRIVDASQFVNSAQPPRNKSKDWEFVMKKHQVADSIFIKSHDYYAGYPKQLEAMYEKVIDRLSEMQSDNYENELN